MHNNNQHISYKMYSKAVDNNAFKDEINLKRLICEKFQDLCFKQSSGLVLTLLLNSNMLSEAQFLHGSNKILRQRAATHKEETNTQIHICSSQNKAKYVTAANIFSKDFMIRKKLQISFSKHLFVRVSFK